MEKNWREVYNPKKEFTVLINGWEKWEPKDKSKKNAIRTVWRTPDGRKSDGESPQEKKHWWEKEREGYDTDMNLKAEFDLDEDVVRKAVGKEKYDKESIDGSNDEDGGGSDKGD